jgi:hypothetical protein
MLVLVKGLTLPLILGGKINSVFFLEEAVGLLKEMAWLYLTAPSTIVSVLLSFQSYHSQNGEEKIHPKALCP